jgi:hypothetical protein
MLPKHKKKMKRKKLIKIERPEPIRMDGSSPYAEYLPTRFRQYNPDKGDFERGEKAVMPGGFTNIDPDKLMEANFGRRGVGSKASRRPGMSKAGDSPKSSVKQGLNFYGN